MVKWEDRYNSIYKDGVQTKIKIGSGSNPILICNIRCSYKLSYPIRHISNEMKLSNNGTAIRINYDNSEISNNHSVMFNGDNRFQTNIQKYILRDILLLVPNRHTLTTDTSDMEIQLVHESDDGDKQLQIISIMIKVDNSKEDDETYNFLEYISESIPEHGDNPKSLPIKTSYTGSSTYKFTLQSIFPNNRSFYTYNDIDNISYMVFKHHKFISQEALNRIKTQITVPEITSPNPTDSIIIFNNEDSINDIIEVTELSQSADGGPTSNSFEDKLDTLSCKPIDLYKYKKVIFFALLLLLVTSLISILY
jgi:carbonic anhydrase